MDVAGRLMAGWDTTASWVIDPKPGIDVTLSRRVAREWCEKGDNRGSKSPCYDGNICVLVGDDAIALESIFTELVRGLFAKVVPTVFPPQQQRVPVQRPFAPTVQLPSIPCPSMENTA